MYECVCMKVCLWAVWMCVYECFSELSRGVCMRVSELSGCVYECVFELSGCVHVRVSLSSPDVCV